MKKTILFLFILITQNLYSNIGYINFEKIPEFEKYEKDILYIINNSYYMHDWTPEWTYDIDKDKLISKMEKEYGIFLNLYEKNKDNFELCLFLHSA